jgi:hypothetical protein
MAEADRVGDQQVSSSMHEAMLAAAPLIARRKFKALEALVADSQALVKSCMAREDVLEGRLAELHGRFRSTDPKDALRLAELNREREELAADLQTARDERARRNGIRANAEQIVSQLKYNFLSSENCHGSWGLRAYAGPPAKPRDGESLSDAIRRVRSEIGRLQGELTQVREAPPSTAEIKAHLVGEVDRLAREGQPTVSFEGGKVQLTFPDQLRYAPPGQGLSAPSGSASKLDCWLHRDEIVRALSAFADDIKGGLSAAERAQRIERLEADLLQHEFDEESLIEQALAAGIDVHRRRDASAYALLSIVPISEGEAIAAHAAKAKEAPAAIAAE